MTLATLGWGSWWVAALLRALAPAAAPGPWATAWVACAFAAIGLAWGLVTLRAKLAWVAITAVPLFANGSLLLLPALLPFEQLAAR